MGNASPSLKGLDTRFQQLGIDDNELLSTLIVVKDSSTQQKLLIKQINIASQADYSRLLKELRQRKVISTKKIGRHLLRVRDVEGGQQSQICGKSFKIMVYLEYISGSLKTVFEERLRTRRHFDEDELMSLMKNVVSGLIMLHDNSFKNIHLSKESILVTSQNTYKIMDNQLCNRIHPFFEVLNGVPPKSGVYLAPQLLSDISRESVEFYQTPKADLFTLAVLILQLGTLQSMDPYYDYENKKVDLNGLHKITQQLPMSFNIKRILHDMLRQQQEQRIGLLSLKETLSGGLQTQTNQELCAFNSVEEISNKQSARTFISLSKKASRPQSTHQPSKENSIKMPANQQISQYITQMQHRIPQPHPPVNFNNIHFQTTTTPIQPSYVPIETTMMSRPSNISVNTVPTNSLQNQKIQTPKSQVVHQLKIINTRQFDTPVNLLLQPYPETIPPKPSEQQIKQQLPHVQDKPEAIKTDMISSKAISSKSQIVYSKNQIFNNKSYGELKFGNGARYEGEFNQQGQFQGNGILYYPNGKPCYSGSWKNNSFHGFGVLHNEHPVQNNSKETHYQEFKLEQIDWLYYEGEFSLDKKEGFGTLYMANGDKFSGCFKDDRIEGFGSFFKAKEQKNINGIWINNVLKH